MKSTTAVILLPSEAVAAPAAVNPVKDDRAVWRALVIHQFTAASDVAALPLPT